jgi:hypothetical protein
MGVEALRTRMLLPSPSACFTLFSRQGEELSQSARSKGFSCDEWEAIDPVPGRRVTAPGTGRIRRARERDDSCV